MDSWRRNCVYPVFLTPCVGGLSFIAFICMVIPVFATTFVFNGFNETNLILQADASLIRSQSVLALTTQTSIMLGRALYSIPVRMKRNETLSSFSTTFVFSIVPPHSEPGGHGIAFILTPYTTLMGSLASQYLGLLNNTSNGQPYNHLFAVEFDTVQSVEFNDPDGNHVAVDSEFNGRLGNFDLARLYDHSKNPGTTRVMGTLGYIAPELTRTGKATPSSDVFSFGVLLLEVACGRKAVELVEWMWEMYARGGLLDAADPELGNEYEAGEMEKVLKLGLLCSSWEPEKRLGIRQVCQILEGEAPLPDVHMANPHPEDQIMKEMSSGGFNSISLTFPR